MNKTTTPKKKKQTMKKRQHPRKKKKRNNKLIGKADIDYYRNPRSLIINDQYIF